jgi:hypothetical protein
MRRAHRTSFRSIAVGGYRAVMVLALLAGCGGGTSGGTGHNAVPSPPGGGGAAQAPAPGSRTSTLSKDQPPNLVRDQFGNLVQVNTVCGNRSCDLVGDCIFCPEECGTAECEPWADRFSLVVRN